VTDPRGRPVSTFTVTDASAIPPNATAGTSGRGAGVGLGVAQGIDDKGRLYFRLPTVRFDGGAPSVADSVPVVRSTAVPRGPSLNSRGPSAPR